MNVPSGMGASTSSTRSDPPLCRCLAMVLPCAVCFGFLPPGSTLTSESRIVASQEQVSCDLAGEAAILNLKSGVYYGLDPVGSSIWNLVQEPRTFASLQQLLLEEYEVEPM